MSTIDIGLIIILGLGGIQGYRKGFIRQISLLAALLLGLWVTIHFSNWTSSFLVKHFEFARKNTALWAFAITFAAVVVVIEMSGRILERMLRKALLGWVNRVIGLGLGILTFALMLSVLISLFSRFGVLDSIISVRSQRASLLFGPIQSFAPSIFPYLHQFCFEQLNALKGS